MYLDYIKQSSLERVISVLNGVGYNILNRYPTAEVQSWTIQRNEAILELNTPDNEQSVEMFPFLAEVCKAQFGYTNNGDLIVQIREKAEIVRANAASWAFISAYVNGVRARVELQMEAATTEDEVLTAMHTALTEVAEFRALHGV